VTVDELDGKTVRISDPSHTMYGFCGEAQDRYEHGWLDVQLDDGRVVGPLGVNQVSLAENELA
jgi:hypothetical protein